MERDETKQKQNKTKLKQNRTKKKKNKKKTIFYWSFFIVKTFLKN